MTLHRAVVYATIAVVAAAIATGLYISGPPSEQRLERLDERRVADLRQLSAALRRYYAETAALPADLAELADGLRLSSLPLDPATAERYGYAVAGDAEFELCAEFSRNAESVLGDDFWSHGAGRHCFEFDYSDLLVPPAPR